MDMSRNKKVLIPGMFSRGCVYDNFKDQLEEAGLDCFIVDFPSKKGVFGFLYSDDCELDFEAKLQYLLMVLREIKGPYDLIAHSAGAPLALRAAMEDDIDPEKICLLSPAPIFNIFHLYPSVVKSFWFIIKNPYFMTKSIEIPYENFRWSMTHTLSEKKSREIYPGLRQEAGQFIFQVGLWPLDTVRSTFVDFTKINCPIRIMVGDQDRVTPYQIGGKICLVAKLFRERKRLVADVDCQVLRGCSHWIFDEASDEAVSLVAGSIDRKLIL